MNRRGITQLVAVLLTVLVVITGIVIIFVVVDPLPNGGNESGNSSNDSSVLPSKKILKSKNTNTPSENLTNETEKELLVNCTVNKICDDGNNCTSGDTRVCNISSGKFGSCLGVNVANGTVCGGGFCNGAGVCEGSENKISEEFIFTFWPSYVSEVASKPDKFDSMMATGMTHAGIYFRPETTIAEQVISDLRAKGYKIALEVSPGHYSWGGLAEIVHGDDDSKYLAADCLNKTVCERWDNRYSIDPSYEGIYWQNTLENTRNVTKRANADIVLYDTEIWSLPKNVEWSFTSGDPGRDCNCEIVNEANGGIGHDKYREYWTKKGVELYNIPIETNPNTLTLFYGVLNENGRTLPLNTGLFRDHTELNFPLGTGDIPSPSFYFVPNTKAFKKNADRGSISGTIPWVSFTHLSGYNGSAIAKFDSSVSKEVGRLLKDSGAKGFIVYPNGINTEDKFDGGLDYWNVHASEMIAGFKEGGAGQNLNKISNGDFEEFEGRVGGYTRDENDKLISTGGQWFNPVYWTWEDSNVDYVENVTFNDLSDDSISGMYSWRHGRLGEVGNRIIYSDNFSIESAGEYEFSIRVKADVISSASNIQVSILDLSGEEKMFTETEFVDSWVLLGDDVTLSPGDYKIKIFIKDNSGQVVNIFLDDARLMI